MVGAGARALIQEGYRRAGRSIEGARAGAAVRRLHRPLRGAYLRPLASVRRRRRRARQVCNSRLEIRRVHQQGGKAGDAPACKSSASPSRFAFICGQDTIFEGGKALSKPDPRVLFATIEKGRQRAGALDHGRRFGHRHPHGASRDRYRSSPSISATRIRMSALSRRTGSSRTSMRCGMRRRRSPPPAPDRHA
jgi:hypothetical protein